jgi:hypothetical protein
LRNDGKRFPNVKLIRNQDNVGFQRNNIGVGQAKENIFASSTLIPLLPKILLLKILNFVTSEAVKNDLGIVDANSLMELENFLPESKRGVPTLGLHLQNCRSL